jgi:retinol dehydrogenase 12
MRYKNRCEAELHNRSIHGWKKMDYDLLEKTYVVTGATSGIGLATAIELKRRGASVIGVGRSPERCRAAEYVLRDLGGNSNVDYLSYDLSLQSQVHGLAAQIRELLASRGIAYLDGLVNNAGTFTFWQFLTSEGFETQWAVNHLASFLLTNELLPMLQAAPTGRIVTVSSGSHYSASLNWNDLQLRRGYNGLRAYGQTKLANILFTLELNRRLGDQANVRGFAVDPGLVKTEIGFKGTPALVRWVWMARRASGDPPEKPAHGIVYLLTDSSLPDAQAIYWQDGKPRQPSLKALDAESAKRLWTISAQMCSISNSTPQEQKNDSSTIFNPQPQAA